MGQVRRPQESLRTVIPRRSEKIRTRKGPEKIVRIERNKRILHTSAPLEKVFITKLEFWK